MVCSSSFDNDQLVNIHQHFWKECLIIVHKLAFHHTNFMEILQLKSTISSLVFNISVKLDNFTTFKALLSAVLTDFCYLIHDKSGLNHGMVDLFTIPTAHPDHLDLPLVWPYSDGDTHVSSMNLKTVLSPTEEEAKPLSVFCCGICDFPCHCHSFIQSSCRLSPFTLSYAAFFKAMSLVRSLP